jgi:hypothetical protein
MWSLTSSSHLLTPYAERHISSANPTDPCDRMRQRIAQKGLDGTSGDAARISSHFASARGGCQTYTIQRVASRFDSQNTGGRTCCFCGSSSNVNNIYGDYFLDDYSEITGKSFYVFMICSNALFLHSIRETT